MRWIPPDHYLPDTTTAIRHAQAGLVAQATAAGVAPDKLMVDFGHDFRMNTLQSLEVTRRLGELCSLGHPVLVALSNMDFIGLPIGQRV